MVDDKRTGENGTRHPEYWDRMRQLAHGMALLFVGGVMNLYWIAGLALLVAVEKLALFGRATAAVAGVVLLVAGATVFLTG